MVQKTESNTLFKQSYESSFFGVGIGIGIAIEKTHLLATEH